LRVIHKPIKTNSKTGNPIKPKLTTGM